MMTANELFSLPLDTPNKQQAEQLGQARERLVNGESEIKAARNDPARMAAAMATANDHSPDAQRRRVENVLSILSHCVDKDNTAVSKPMAIYHAFNFMNPLASTNPHEAAMSAAYRRVVDELKLTELATAILIIAYFTLDVRGSFAWRKLNPWVVALPSEE